MVRRNVRFHPSSSAYPAPRSLSDSFDVPPPRPNSATCAWAKRADEVKSKATVQSFRMFLSVERYFRVTVAFLSVTEELRRALRPARVHRAPGFAQYLQCGWFPL